MLEKSNHASPTHGRGLRGAPLWSLPRRERLRLLRLACAGVLRRSVSTGEPALGALPLPPIRQRLMRAILLLRGVYDRNELGTRALARCARGLHEHLRARAAPREPDPLPTYDWASGNPDEFYERFVRRQRPVRITRAPTRTGDWSVAWLVRNYGDLELTLIDTEGASYKGRIRDLEGAAPNGQPLYIHNFPGLFAEDAERRRDLRLDELARWVRRPEPSTLGLFASVHGGTGALMHCADNMNTFLLLEGRKRWTLIDPSYFLLAYPFLSHTNNYQLSLVRSEEESAELPLFRYCPRYEVELEAGDVLFVPTWWYHCVKNREARTLAVAVRWAPHAPGEVRSNRLYSFLDGAARRTEADSRGIHQDSVELVGTGAARSCWGIPPAAAMTARRATR